MDFCVRCSLLINTDQNIVIIANFIFLMFFLYVNRTNADNQFLQAKIALSLVFSSIRCDYYNFHFDLFSINFIVALSHFDQPTNRNQAKILFLLYF